MASGPSTGALLLSVTAVKPASVMTYAAFLGERQESSVPEGAMFPVTKFISPAPPEVHWPSSFRNHALLSCVGKATRCARMTGGPFNTGGGTVVLNVATTSCAVAMCSPSLRGIHVISHKRPAVVVADP